ncbi:MAG: hypothetical protein PF904_17455 [Kiritimatiellae bacterium]|nr:hypothetical protein [Kiritimatiellia bacterium]
MKRVYAFKFICPLTLLTLLITPASAFEPTNLTECVMWLQADAGNIQTNSETGRITQWNDISGNGNHAYQTNTNRQPLYVENGPNGHPTIYFDERYYNYDYSAGLLTDNQLTNSFSVFIVTRIIGAGERGISAWRRILPSRDKNWFLGTYRPGTFYMHGDSGEVSGMPTKLKSSFQHNRTYTMAAVNNMSEQRFYVDGHDLTGNAANKTPPGRLTIGGDGSPSKDPSNSEISEVIVYDRALSSIEREQVENYLATRYSVTDEGFNGPEWNGQGASSNWSDSSNWKQTMPANPMLAFNTNLKTTSINDLTGLTIDSVMIWDHSWNFSGNPVTLNNGIFCNPSGSATWAMNTILPAGTHAFTVNDNNRLTLSGLLSGAGDLLMGYGANSKGTLAISSPTNTFTGAVKLMGGTAEITGLADAGESSSLGAASGDDATILIGNCRNSNYDGLRYIGTETASTDRPFEFVRNCAIENASSSDAGMTFRGAWSAADRPDGGWTAAVVYLRSSSSAVNTLNNTIANGPSSSNPLYIRVQSGTWEFTQTGTFTGSCTIEDGGTALISGTASGCPGSGRLVVNSGGTIGGTGLVSSSESALQYPGATISPGDPAVNGGVGCLTYNNQAGLDGVRIVCQVNSETNDLIKFNAEIPLPGFMSVEIQANSAETCPQTLKILEATSLGGVTDLSGWEISGPCTYTAAVEGNAVILHKSPPPDLGDWSKSMLIRFKGYQGTSTLTNFPALIKLWEGCGNNRFHYSDCEAEGTDLIFTDANGASLSHEIETWNISGESHIWVKIPALTSSTEITARWNNPEQAADANPFIPTDLPDCGLWLHAAEGVITNASGYVSSWEDQSGNGYDAYQTYTSKQPTWTADAANNHPGVRFDASGDKDGLYGTWSSTNGPHTIIVAGTHVGAQGFGWRRIVQGSSGYNWGIATEGSGYFRSWVYRPPSYYTYIAELNLRPTPGSPFVASVNSDGTNSIFCLNGFASDPVSEPGGPNFLGMGTGGHSGDGWDGDVLELITYDRSLTSAERQQVERYLALKYDSLSAHRVPSVGLSQWFRGDYVNADVLDGSTSRVSKCENQIGIVGSMHAYQSDTTRQPELVSSSFNGKPALRFDAVTGEYDSLKSSATPIGSTYSIFAVSSTSATNAGERVILQGCNSVSKLSIADGSIKYQSSGTVSQLLPCQENVPSIKTMICNGISSRFFVNGVNLSQDDSNYAAWGPDGGAENSVFYYGAGTADSTLDLPLDGDLAEVLVYNRALSDTERQRVEAYLSKRYAIPTDTSNSDVWSSEFNGVWHFTGTDHLLLADASDAQNGAVLLGQGSPVSTNAFAGEALKWNGSTQLGRSRTQLEDTPQTFSFWSKQQTPVANEATVLAGTNGTPFASFNNANGKLQVAGTDAADQKTPTTGAWTHYAIVTDPSDQSVQVYGNGAAVTTIPDSLARNLPTEEALTFGHAADTADATKTFSGILDEVRLETVPRSADWIKATYMTQAENERFVSYNYWGTLIIVR